MQIQYSIAQPQELEEVFSMVRCVIQAMHAAGIRQWHEDIYPRKDDLCRDIARGEMRIGRIGGRIAVIYVLNAEQEDSYNSAAWQHPEKSYRILHRLCVHPDFQNMGLARKTMEHMQNKRYMRVHNIQNCGVMTLIKIMIKIYCWYLIIQTN